ncbi:hypothetical protein D6774_02245 [Candidatus Woesearchaeota archaeon]|nr:MAG: hypothetical protein D6774_02245 [Candidatus Woesearchaeota archaeon]
MSNLSKLRSELIEYTRKKIRESVSEDQLIIQAISSSEELDRVLNILSKRLREWYALYNPEFEHAIDSHEAFVTILLQGRDVREPNTMGADLSQEHVQEMHSLARRIADLYELKKEEQNYINEVMEENFPNLKAVAGGLIGAKLLAIAGGIKNLMLFPASTVQMLGAEKAFFRHLKNKKISPPKYGILFQHPLVTKASKKDKGRVARALADKISIASRIDYFKGEFKGDVLIKEVEEKFS